MAIDDASDGEQIQWVEVTFTGTQQNRIVSLRDVYDLKESRTCIQPVHDQDFQRDIQYQVKWFCCQSNGRRCEDVHVHPYEFRSALIHRLSGSRQKILDARGKGPRQKFKASPHESRETETHEQRLRGLKKELLERKKVTIGVKQKRSYEIMAKSKNIRPAKVPKTFEDSEQSDGLQDSVNDDQASVHSEATENSPISPRASPSQSNPDLGNCTVQLRTIHPRLGCTASQGNRSSPTLPTEASQFAAGPSSQLSQNSLIGHTQYYPLSSQAGSRTSGMEDIMLARIGNGALSASQSEAQMAAQNRIGAQQQVQAQLEDQQRPQNVTGPTNEQQLLNAYHQREQLFHGDQGGRVNGIPEEERQRQEALVLAVLKERQDCDGYSGPDRTDSRGEIQRDVRCRRELAVSVYELYHKEGGPYHAERVMYRYRIVGQRIHLTQTITVDYVRYGLVNKRGPKKFISATASVLFTPQERITSALDPTQVKNVVPGQPRPRKIDRNKLLLLLSLYHDFVFGRNAIFSLEEKESMLLKGCAYLSRFLYDERKKAIEKIREQTEGENIGRA